MNIRRFPWDVLLIGVLLLILAMVTSRATTVQPKVVERIVETRIEVPKSLLTCSPEPVAGAVWLTQRDVAATS